MKRSSVRATLLLAGEVFTPRRRIRRGGLVIRGRKIFYAGSAAGAFGFAKRLHDRSRAFELEVLEFPDDIAVPGLVDIHLHGGNGADFMDGRPETAAAALAPHLRDGTTSVLATVMTAGHEDILRAIASVRRAVEEKAVFPEVLGIHLEGPYLAREKAGAQPAAHIRPFAPSEMKAYLDASRGTVRIATLAPETKGSSKLIALLKKRGIVAAAGHSKATFAQARDGIRRGIRHGTHLFNAMSGVFHRDPGLAGALLLDDAVSVELIADGFHVHPAVLELVLRLKPFRKVVLVSDATRRAGLADRPLRTARGKLYGSSITLIQAVRNLAAWTRLPFTEILAMATENPAEVVGAEKRKGRLARGFDADIVLLDRRLRVRKIFLSGTELQKKIYRNNITSLTVSGECC